MNVYKQTTALVQSELKSLGFSRIASGVSIILMSPGVYGWLSLSGNDYFLVPLLGMVYENVNKITFEILRTVDPRREAMRPSPRSGPPLLMTNLGNLTRSSVGSSYKASWENGDQRLEIRNGY